MRFPLSQYQLVDRIQDTLDQAARRKSSASDPHLKNWFDCKILGMMKLAGDVGVDCECGFTSKEEPDLEFCRCRPMTVEERRDQS